jgi:minor histocompatibility antigen H13
MVESTNKSSPMRLPDYVKITMLISHVAVLVNAVLPVFVPYPPNINVIVTAAIVVFCGCWRSIKPEPPVESMSKKDAYKFPLVGSVMLFGLFLAFKFLPKDMVNMVLTLYFIVLGTLGLVATVEPLIAGDDDRTSGLRKQHKVSIPKVPVVLKEGLEFEFSIMELLLCIPAVGFCYWYWQTKHWLANNVLGIAFSLQGVEHLSLGTVQNGVILLCGLFFYDIFWVFCTPVMVSVAKSFDAPIKLLFPKVMTELTDSKAEFSMLGLGDIVIPGIMVAIVLRYDIQRHMTGLVGGKVKNASSPCGTPRFFYSCFAGYVLGIAATIVVMNVFQAAQPALLYIVPSVLFTTFLHAWLAGEASSLLHWSEAPMEDEHGGVDQSTEVAAVDKKKDS